MSSSNPTLHEDDLEFLLIASKVANDLGHYEGGALHTAITSRDELREFARLVYDRGFRAGRASVPTQSRFG